MICSRPRSCPKLQGSQVRLKSATMIHHHQRLGNLHENLKSLLIFLPLAAMISEDQTISNIQTDTKQLPSTALTLVAHGGCLEGTSCCEETDRSSEIQKGTSSWSAETHGEHARRGTQNGITFKYKLSNVLGGCKCPGHETCSPQMVVSFRTKWGKNSTWPNKCIAFDPCWLMDSCDSMRVRNALFFVGHISIDIYRWLILFHLCHLWIQNQLRPVCVCLFCIWDVRHASRISRPLVCIYIKTAQLHFLSTARQVCQIN